jgi:NAD(P)-dependent dehydrogenase (short-subunit alcohol dehydrogenase family)
MNAEAPVTDYSSSSTAEDVTEGVDLSGKTIAITGCNSGIGMESARVLALRGAHIVGLARTAEKAQAAFDQLGLDKDRTTAIACELSEPSSVRDAARSLSSLGEKLDVLLCNAGIMALPERTVRHGLELQFLTNHMGHFMLVNGAMEALADDARVVVVSSGAHHMAPDVGVDLDDLDGAKEYSAWRQYGQSKLANLLFARSLQKRFDAEAGKSRVASSLHPGVIKTNLGRHDQASIDDMFGSMDASSIKSIPQGAATQVLLCARPEARHAHGGYFSDCQPKETSERGQDDELAERLWQKSEELAASL